MQRQTASPRHIVDAFPFVLGYIARLQEVAECRWLVAWSSENRTIKLSILCDSKGGGNTWVEI